MASLLYALAAFLIAVLAWKVSIAGEGVAKRQLETFNSSETSEKTFKSLTLVLKKTPETPLAAEIIRCSLIRCAFYIDKSVHVIDTDQIKIIKSHQ